DCSLLQSLNKIGRNQCAHELLLHYSRSPSCFTSASSPTLHNPTPHHPHRRRPNPRKPRLHRPPLLTIPQKSSVLLSASGRRKARSPTGKRPLPIWNAAGRRKAHIWFATNWSEWERPEIIANSPCIRMTARPATTPTPRLPIPAQSHRAVESPLKAISGPTIPALPPMARPQ